MSEANDYFSFFFLHTRQKTQSGQKKERGDARTKLRRMSTAALPTIRSAGRKPCIAFSADLFVAVVFRCENLERGFDYAAAEAV